MRNSDWSSDVCSSDLHPEQTHRPRAGSCGGGACSWAARFQPLEDFLARLAQDRVAVEAGDDVGDGALGAGFAPGLAGNQVAFGGAAEDRKSTRLNSSH